MKLCSLCQAVGSEIDSEAQGVVGPRGLSGRYSVTSYGSGGLSHKESKTRRTSPSLHSGAFSQSLINLTQVRMIHLSENGPCHKFCLVSKFCEIAEMSCVLLKGT